MSLVVYRPLPADIGCTCWPEYYRVGDDGSIWSRIKPGRFGGLGPWRQLRPVVVARDRGGTLKVNLRTDEGRRKSRHVAVDVCVCRAFQGPRPLGCVPYHFPDPSPSNCRAGNLRWAPRGTSVAGIDRQAHRSRERAARNRTSRGSIAQLSDDEVIAARQAAAQGQTAADIAEAIGVGRWVIDLAIRGRTYRDLPGAIPDGSARRARGSRVNRAKLDEERVAALKAELARGQTPMAIAERFGVSVCTVYGIRTGRTWRHVEPAL
jgi:hypothetical protein